jgi:hypothetical protein
MFKTCIHNQEKPSKRNQTRPSSHLNNNKRRKEEGIGKEKEHRKIKVLD